MNAFRQRRAVPEPDIDLLPPERRHATRSFSRGPDVVDAEFITVVDAPRRAFDVRRFNDNCRPTSRAAAAVSPSVSAIGLTALLQGAERRLSRLSGRAFAAAVIGAVLIVFGLAGGLSAALVDGGRTPSVAMLDFTHVSLTPRDANGMRVLMINAILENRSAARLAVPTIRADLLANGVVVESIAIAPPVAVVEGGQSHGIAVRLPHPGGKTPELRLSFADSTVQSL